MTQGASWVRNQYSSYSHPYFSQLQCSCHILFSAEYQTEMHLWHRILKTVTKRKNPTFVQILFIYFQFQSILLQILAHQLVLGWDLTFKTIGCPKKNVTERNREKKMFCNKTQVSHQHWYWAIPNKTKSLKCTTQIILSAGNMGCNDLNI